MSDKLCAVCVEKVESGTDESKWGFDFGSFGSLWFHYRCADDLANASRRIRGQPEYTALETRLSKMEEERDELRQLITEAATHMAHHAPDGTPFNQPLWERMNERVLGHYQSRRE